MGEQTQERMNLRVTRPGLGHCEPPSRILPWPNYPGSVGVETPGVSGVGGVPGDRDNHANRPRQGISRHHDHR